MLIKDRKEYGKEYGWNTELWPAMEQIKEFYWKSSWNSKAPEVGVISPGCEKLLNGMYLSA